MAETSLARVFLCLTRRLSALAQNAKLQLLLENGADINDADDAGNTALMWAALDHGRDRANPDIVRLLLDRGADVHKTDVDEQNVLDHIVCTGNPLIVQMLKEAGAEESSYCTLDEPIHCFADPPLLTDLDAGEDSLPLRVDCGRREGQPEPDY